MFPFKGSCPFLDVQKILRFHGFVRYFNDILEKFRMAQFYCWLRTEAVLCHIKLTLDFHYTIAINFCVDMLKNHQKITVVKSFLSFITRFLLPYLGFVHFYACV